MLLRLYTVYDSKAELYMPPFCQKTKGEALRGFADAIQGGGDNNLAKHPEDFTLFEVGLFEDSDGTIQMHDAKISLANGIEFSATKEEPRARLSQVPN